ncbi:zinc finger and BTB domain-containing protein 21 [Xyrichtys novacula]|uniref:Zinc finger and BTB domain-containing protein 21 n=1 Tax=Xyrichtys novacula TaxID=13765 RepID=A0AAV1FW10_XYRNO|nr:zinc finger and BTB domain-containing protein 21 [Xyrichtys novacula]
MDTSNDTNLQLPDFTQSPMREQTDDGQAMESLVHYSNPSHALSVLGVLNEQRLRGQMCDVVLVVGEQKYQAQKSVLAASSEYFQSLFARRDSETLKVVNLDFCEPDAFEIVLNYIYSSSLFVDKSSLAAIQELGYSLGIPFLTNIVSTRPHASYCVSRKRLSFSEGEENDVQTRSVIVCRVRNDTAHPPSSNYHRKTSERASPPHCTRESTQSPSESPISYESAGNPESISRKSSEHMMQKCSTSGRSLALTRTPKRKKRSKSTTITPKGPFKVEPVSHARPLTEVDRS